MARKIEVQIVGDARGLQRAFGQASNAGSSFGRSLGTVAKYGALAAGAAGIGGLAVVLKAGIAEFSEASKVAAQTGAVLASTGGIANVTAGQVSALSEALMRKTGVDDESIQSGQNMLLTFTKIRNEVGAGNDVFNQATKATLDLSVAMGKDMQGSAILVGKALNDSIKGMTALSKAGIQFTQDQKDSIKAMVESGNAMGAQKAILKELETQFGGSAEAIGKTLPGQLNILKQSFSNMAGEIVGSLVPAFSKGVQAASDFVTKLSAAKGFQAKIEVVVEGAKNLATATAKIGVDIAKQIGDTLGKVDWAATGNSIAAGIGAAFKKGIPLLAQFATTITEGFQKAIQNADWTTIGAAIGKGIKDGATKAIKERFTKDLPAAIKDSAGPMNQAAFAVAVDVATSLGDKLGLTTKQKIPKSMGAVPELIRAGIDPAVAVAMAGGGRIGSGLSGGLTAALSGVGASVANTIISQIQMSELQIKQKYGIHSPSTVWAERIGKPLAEGIVQGMDGGLALLFPKAQARLQAYTDKLEAQVKGARDRLGTAMSSLSDKLLRGFDAETGGTMTPAEQEIAAINARRRIDELNRALADAQATGDAAAVVRAQEDLHLHALEATAANERKAWDDRRTAMREQLETRLGALGEHFQKEGATVATALLKINTIMRAFGITFAESGMYVGRHFAAGLATAIGGAAGGAAGVKGSKTGGATTVNVSMPNYLGDPREVVQVLRQELNRTAGRNDGLVFV